MNWIKENVTLSILVSLISALFMGVAYAAVLNSDVQTLKQEVDGIPPQESILVRLGRLEEKTNDIKNSVDRIERSLNRNASF